MPPGGMPGGGPHGGMPPGMPPGDGDPFTQMSAVGLMRPEMDFAAPMQGNLRISMDARQVVIGKVDGVAETLSFRTGATELGEGDIRAFASYESGDLVIEINSDNGVQVTHMYQLEAQGHRLRIKTHLVSKQIPMPGGIDSERLFDRVERSDRVNTASKPE